MQKTKLRVAREARGLSRASLSRQTHEGGGVTLSAALIEQVEKGYRPSPAYAEALARAVGIDVHELFEQVGE